MRQTLELLISEMERARLENAPSPYLDGKIHGYKRAKDWLGCGCHPLLSQELIYTLAMFPGGGALRPLIELSDSETESLRGQSDAICEVLELKRGIVAV